MIPQAEREAFKAQVKAKASEPLPAAPKPALPELPKARPIQGASAAEIERRRREAADLVARSSAANTPPDKA